MPEKPRADAVDPKTGALPTVKWIDSDMKTSYANVCNVGGTREEVTLLFGTNQNWIAGQEEVTVRLSDRIILSPYAAKRLYRLLGGVVAEYERRFGPLGMGGAEAPAEKPVAGIH